ncbi:hypothetical protein HDU93_007592 [Gonapodya sp. JEL0774]|nr:hypothetical protein HDU93_007592 [Gonapodya sp. JEL0774]
MGEMITCEQLSMMQAYEKVPLNGQTVFVFAMLALGRLGGKELDAGGVCYLVGVGLSSSLDTLCSQAVGVARKSGKESDKYILGKILQRAFLLVTMVTVAVSIMWWNAEFVLVALGQDPEISKLASVFIRYLIPGFLPSMLFECMRHYLQAQGIPSAATYCVAVTAVVNIPLTYFLVLDTTYSVGYVGAAIATSIVQMLSCLLLALYIVFVDGRSGWGGWTWEALDLSSFIGLLRLAIPALVMCLFDGSVFEILCLIAGLLSPAELAAQTILTTNTAGMLWMIASGFGFAASIRVGNEVGQGNAKRARAAAWRTFSVAICVAVLNATVLLFGHNFWIQLYTSDPEVRLAMRVPLLLIPLHHVLDACNVALSGAIRGTGYMLFGALCQVAHYVVGIPIGASLALIYGWDLTGLWLGLLVSTTLVVVGELVFVGNLDWEKEVENASQRIREQ